MTIFPLGLVPVMVRTCCTVGVRGDSTILLPTIVLVKILSRLTIFSMSLVLVMVKV